MVGGVPPPLHAGAGPGLDRAFSPTCV